VPAPEQAAAATPLPVAPPAAATGEREINAGQDGNG
jgi:hypothetical protein